MPAVASKELTAEQEAEYKKDAAATIALLGPLCFAIVTGGQLLNQSRPMLVRKICKGDQSAAAVMLAAFAGYGGLAEFLLNPVMGRLSDRFGRRPLLLVSPVVCAALRAMVFAFPTSSTIIMLERTFSSAVVTGFFSTLRAMINDKLDGKDLVLASGVLGMYAGSGVIIGPFIEVLILRFFNARANFAAVAGINFVVAGIMYKMAKETLPSEKRKPVTLKDCSPFTFVDMYKVGSVNRRLMLILLLQSFGELRILQDINMLFLRDCVQWTPQEISYFMSTLGVSVVVNGKIIKWSLQKFGMQGHTTMSNLVMALAFYAQGAGSPKSPFSKYLTQFFAGACWFLGGRKRDAVEANCTGITLANTDMGKGQVASALSNFKSLAAILGPPISARAYAYGLSTGKPGLPYRFITIAYILAEVTHLSMTREQMGIKEGE